MTPSMKLQEILNQYNDALLDQISTDKIDSAVNLRLPRVVVIQEITSALSSLSYISEKISSSKPPTFAFLKLIMNSPDLQVDIEGFRDKVISFTKELSQKAFDRKQLIPSRNYQFYINILKRAWENDGNIDRSELSILEAIRTELGIWKREHYTLEHHPSILQLWDMNNSYVETRNLLLSTGIVLTHEDKYVIAEEIALQIRRSFGMELMDEKFRRMLLQFTKEDLQSILEHYGLVMSGTKDELIERIINSKIPPTELLNYYAVEILRDYCKHVGIQSSGVKNLVITNIIQFFDQNRDLITEVKQEAKSLLPETPETRELDKEKKKKILFCLSNDQLYDCLLLSYLPTSGSKDEKINRLLISPWSERSVINKLRKEDLSFLCKRLGIASSGAKSELIDRILEEAIIKINKSVERAITEDLNKQLDAATADQSKEAVNQVEESVNITTPLPPPNCFNEVDTEYKDLDYDEKIILSLIKDIKSLTEQEIERAALQYNLGWFLTRANMSEIIAKLKQMGKQPIKIRSVKSINIYEWVGDNIKTVEVIEKRSAKDIIDALRQGVVPYTNLDLLMVGQANARKHLIDLLDETSHRKSPFKFIRGPYGSGKTFLCSWLKEYALQNEYAVASINIGPDQPLSDLPVFFSGLINGLRTSEKRDSSALVDILEAWLLNIHNKAVQIETLTSNVQNKNNLASIVEQRVENELSHLSGIEDSFAPALRAFYKAKFNRDEKTATNAVAWITGSRSISAQSLREIGVKGYLEANNVFPRMRALLEVIDGARYKGLVLLVDELELVRRFPHARQREQALETLRLLIDESGKNGLPGCLTIFTGTDEFFEDERCGIKSYQALAERVSTIPVNSEFVSMRQPIITLESLNSEKLFNVFSKIRDLHGLAYQWNSSNIDDEAMKNLIMEWTTFGDSNIEKKPRPVLREFVHILDLCEENPNVSVNEFLRLNKSITADSSSFSQN